MMNCEISQNDDPIRWVLFDNRTAIDIRLTYKKSMLFKNQFNGVFAILYIDNIFLFCILCTY